MALIEGTGWMAMIAALCCGAWPAAGAAGLLAWVARAIDERL